jgi:Rrf2 family protein
MLTKATEYAIRALVYIAIQNLESKRPGFKEIAQKIDSPEQFTAKILQVLTRKKLINSVKGRGGGFFFDNPGGALPLYEVVTALEGDWSLSKCGFGLKSCDAQNPCPLHHEYLPIREGLYNLLKKETIQSLAHKILGNEATLTRLNLMTG